jgi:pilus assembly protein FimV
MKRMPLSRESVRQALSLLGALFLSIISAQAHALGLGRLVVHSNLDEPLNGQIELIAPKDHEIKTLKAQLASREEFDIAGIERAQHLFEIKYEVSHSPKGQYYIKVTTDRAVREPFLHFLVQVEWSGGRLIREYSVLLDPPQWVAGRPAEIDAPHETVIGEVPPAAPAAATPLEAPAAPAPAPEATTTAAAAPTETLPPLEELPPLTEEKPVVAEAPPASVEQPAAAPAPAPVAEAQPVSPVAEPREPMAAAMPAEAPVAQAQEPAPVPAPQPVAAAPSLAGQEYGPVRSGETLSQITDKLNYDKNLSPQQAMMAILRANPSAFIDNNVNNLKTGKILKLPEHEVVAAIPRDQAAREFKGQYDAWQEYKLKLAGASRPISVAAVEKPAAPAPAVEKPKVGKKAAAEKPAAKGKAEPVDLLRIVRANLDREIPEDSAKTPGVDTTKDAAREKKALTERIATLEEAMESTKMQNKESRDRVGKLQEQAKNTERLIELENKEAAKLQKQLAEKQAAEAKAAAEKAAAEKAAADKAAAEKVAAEKAAADKLAKEKAAVAKPAEEKKAAPAPTASPVAKKPVVAPPPEESFIDSMLTSLSDNAMVLGGGLLVLALLGGGLYAYRRRRASREFSESILSNSSLSAEASIISDTSGQAAASDTSFLSDFSQGGMGNVHTDEVDPIAEAEVYLAYGRDEQAEEILKDAIVKDPARQELKGKLLEIYFQRNDVSAFETLAEELYAALEGRGGKIWDKAEEMGRKLSPNNPMFRGGKPVAKPDANTTLIVNQALDTAPASATTLLETQDMMAATGGLDLAATQGNDPGAGLDFTMNFDEAPAAKTETTSFDMPLDMTSTQETAPATSGFDMDFNLGEPAAADTSSNVVDFALPETSSTPSSSIDFNLPASSTDSTIEFSVGSPGETTQEFPAVSADTNGNGGLPGWDETATKLDLAKAYIDMGDSEGARSILDEVIQEGNDSQKQQARDLASQIAA